METFAEYILKEENLETKIEITYYLQKKTKIFFDKSVVFKLELARLFLNYSKIEVDKNLLLTACLLCNCKKVDNAQSIEKIHQYAKEGADYLQELGFSKRFCKICEEINRYSNSNPRERESDILELVDQFGGMLLNRPERVGFKPDEALVLLEYRNLKSEYNRYLSTFIDFINFMEQIEIEDDTKITAIRKLVKIYNETENLSQFIQKVIYEYEPNIDKLIKKCEKEIAKRMFNNVEQDSRPLFSKETTTKILSHLKEEGKRDIS